jgi:2-dehydrotetronate isomerase
LKDAAMPKFAANLTMMFNEVPFLDRFERAAASGFTAVEFLFPYEYPPAEIGARLKANGLTQALFNLPPGNWAAGERGFACQPGRLDEVMASVDTALPYAAASGVKRLHLMSGHGDRHNSEQEEAFRQALSKTASRLSEEGIDLLIEPINGRDMPGYFLNSFDYAASLISGLGLPNLKLQFDIYHRQILHGDVTIGLRQMMPIIGHVQIASVPSRHEPADGELNWPFLFAELQRLGYHGFVGCEYRPAGLTEAGLTWFRDWQSRA